MYRLVAVRYTYGSMKRSRPKILIVEDEAFILEMYQLKLMQAGYEVVIASNGQEGQSLAELEQPDLILLDILMPKEDGYGLLAALKKNPKTKAIPAIIFSNLSQREEIEKGLKLGAKDFIIKTSVTPAEVARKVEEYLEKFGTKQ